MSVKLSIRNAALNLLARREYSAMELRRKLYVKFPDQHQEVETILIELRQENLQSDERYTEMFIRYRSNKGQGPVKIRFDLKQSGIDEQLINDNLIYAEINWEAIGVQTLDKKFGCIQRNMVKNSQLKAKSLRFLAQRGYDSNLCYSIWHQFLNNAYHD